jgi:hypothetical protein
MRVLVVDDNQDAADSIGLLISGYGVKYASPAMQRERPRHRCKEC